MPSHYEPFGLVYVESALCGTPVIFGENAGAAEVLPPPMGIKLTRRSPELLAELIVKSVGQIACGDAEEIAVPTMHEHVAAFKRVLELARQSRR